VLYPLQKKNLNQTTQKPPQQMCRRTQGFLSSGICVKVNEAAHREESIPNDLLTLMGSRSLLGEKIMNLMDSWTVSPLILSNNRKANG